MSKISWSLTMMSAMQNNETEGIRRLVVFWEILLDTTLETVFQKAPGPRGKELLGCGQRNNQ